MGTKDNPGPNDCYAKAKPDEPMFTLLGRDPLAPDLIDYWADQHLDAAKERLMDVNIGEFSIEKAQVAGNAARKAQEKADEARACAKAMRQWRKANPDV